MSIEYFIAKRSAESKSGARPSVMVRVASISVALSVGVIILSLAIVFGFRREVSSSLMGFTSEAVVTSFMTLNGERNNPVLRSPLIEKLLTEHFDAKAAVPYATLQGVVRSREGVEGVMMRGVDSLYDFDFLSGALTAGTLPRVGGAKASRDLLLSSSLAERMGLEVGDRIELIVSQDDKSLRRDQFKICGLYSTGLDEWDRMVVITDLRNTQRLNGWSESAISGYELSYDSLAEAYRACTAISEELYLLEVEGTENLIAYTAEQIYPAIFDWLNAHNVNAVVIIVIMLVVAGFNMATALLILVLERTRMIGVLKALGMNNGSLQKIFLYRALEITTKGLLWGNIIALAICFAQQRFEIIKLDAQNYLLTHVPIDLGAGWLILLNVGVVAIILLLMVVPARMVSRIKVETTLKFE